MTRPCLLVAVLSILGSSLLAGTYVVNTTADAGPGSLRQGILDANSGACAAPCGISYAQSGRLELLSPLPPLTADHTTINPDSPLHAWKFEVSGAKLTGGDGLIV